MTSRGLTTSPIPDGARVFEIEFDFIDHQLLVRGSDGATGGVPLEPQSVSTFYGRLMGELGRLGLETAIRRMPSEIADAVPFDRDGTHRS